MKTALREIAEIHTGDFRLTPSQNLSISGVTSEMKPRIEAILAKHGLDKENDRSGLRLNALSCVALPTCGLALAESERALPETLEKFEAVLDENGNETDHGILAIRKPWPGITQGIFGDEQRYVDTYWNRWGGKYYFPGDGAIRDKDGYLWITGRVDDVVNVSGHRIGTAELEAIFIEDAAVAESAVIGVKHDLKGQGLMAFVILKSAAAQTVNEAELAKKLNGMVDAKIGKFARPERIVFVPDLPKTRSGKIMRRLLRDISEGRELGNVSTLADPAVVEAIRSKFNAAKA